MSGQGKTTMVIRNHNSGFASNLNKVVNNLRWRLGRCDITAAIVEWRAEPGMPQFSYGRQEDGNIWLHFFEPLPFSTFPEKRIEFRDYAVRVMTGPEAYAMLKLDRHWRQRYHTVYERYLRIRPWILRKVEAIYVAQMAGNHCIGVHYRHPAHDRELLHPIPPPEVFAAWAKRVLPADRPAKVVLATDFQPAVDVFRGHFGDRLVLQPGVQRSPGPDQEQLHHNNSAPSVELGEQILIDCLMLARCDALIHITSNVATAVGYINPTMKMIYCETPRQAGIGYLWSIALVKTGLRPPLKRAMYVVRILLGRGVGVLRRTARRLAGGSS